ncbi:Rare lipoprotein B [Francisella sp. MA067296]|nr:Rare lipoprotein B [Francisella sp. MA067296]
MRLKYIHTMFLFIATVILASCGFHPRGVLTDGNAGNFDSLAGTKFYIEADNYANLANSLKRNLTNFNAIIVNDEKSADYIINIQDAKQESQLTSIIGGASNNTYQLIYTITYNIVKPYKKTPVIPNKSISAQQFWQSNAGTQLAQNNQADRIYTYLEGQLVNNMVTQIAALLPSKNISQTADSDSDSDGNSAQ